MPRRRKPNILFIGIDSLRADHMSCYGYPALTTPHIDRFAQGGTLFEHTYSAHIPTTSGYASMLTGMDVFSTQVVALRHKGPLRPEVTTLPEILQGEGLQHHLRRLHRQPGLARLRQVHRLRRLGQLERGPQPQGPEPQRRSPSRNWTAWPRRRSPSSSSCATWTRTRPICRPRPSSACSTTATSATRDNQSMDPVMAFKPFRDFFATLDAAGHHRQGLRHRPVRRRGRLHGRLPSRPSSPRWKRRASSTTPSSSSTPTTARRCTTTTATSITTGIYDQTLHVPLIIRYPGKVPAGQARARLQPAQGPGAHAAGTGRDRERASPSTARA